MHPESVGQIVVKL